MEHDEVYPPVILSPEGSTEVEEELKNGTPLAPERAASFERMRQMREVHRRSEGMQDESDVKKT